MISGWTAVSHSEFVSHPQVFLGALCLPCCLVTVFLTDSVCLVHCGWSIIFGLVWPFVLPQLIWCKVCQSAAVYTKITDLCRVDVTAGMLFSR